ncbi:MAG TPA: S8 family serine peptidase [Saprospiraceae bacterium]|nr:S8 family serine peptidase [Saprospiraceae bacterium]
MRQIQEHLQARREYLELKKDWDVVLEPPPPSSALRSTPSFAGNWGVGYLGNTALKQQIIQQLKRKVVFIVHDTAGKFQHKYLQKAAWNEMGWNRTSDGLEDGHGHGHHCDGIMVANHPNIPIGAAQVLVDNGYARSIPAKCLGNKGQGSYTWIRESFEQGAHVGEKLTKEGYLVIHSVSLGGNGYDEQVAKMVQQIIDAGQIIVVAAGNTYREGLQHPANVEGVISVGSHDEQGKRSAFSTFDEKLFISAPGQGIYSTLPNDRYATWNGTSMAAPHVAAQIGILGAIYPELSHQVEVKDFLAQFATDLMDSKRDKYTGWGTPKLAPYLGKEIEEEPEEDPSDQPEDNPPEEPDQPDDNPPEETPPAPTEPEKGQAQTLRLEVDYTNYRFQRSGDFPVKFQLSGGIDFQHITKRFMGYAGPKLIADAKDWLSRSMMGLGKMHDRNDGAKYLAYFLEMQMYRLYGHRIRTEAITAMDDKGLQFEVRPDMHYRAETDAANVVFSNGGVEILEYEGVQLIQF